jgi:hypothetical protein
LSQGRSDGGPDFIELGTDLLKEDSKPIEDGLE